MLSVGAIRFEDRFCASKKGGIGEVDGFQHGVPCTWQLAWLTGKTLVATGLAISLLFGTNGHSLCLSRGSISGTVGSFQSEEAFTGRRGLTIVSSLMSSRGRGHEP